jgi:hypothetical protein
MQIRAVSLRFFSPPLAVQASAQSLDLKKGPKFIHKLSAQALFD